MKSIKELLNGDNKGKYFISCTKLGYEEFPLIMRGRTAKEILRIAGAAHDVGFEVAFPIKIKSGTAPCQTE
jgi:hypothetical protein